MTNGKSAFWNNYRIIRRAAKSGQSIKHLRLPIILWPVAAIALDFASSARGVAGRAALRGRE